MLDTLITQLLIPAGTLLIGGVAGLLTKNGRIKAKAEAMRTMAEAYEMRIDALHKVIDLLNKNEVTLTERVAQLDRTIDDKTAQIRRLTDNEMQLLREITDCKNTLIEAQKEIAEYRVAAEYLLEWHCRKPVCSDPEGRIPPNAKLRGQLFRLPPVLLRDPHEATPRPRM
ncbi:MAG: hypothetical protein HDR80_04815 [Bacteroides sp.]|nr:hypothetical protein [Bacteroides sp.]